MDVDRFLQNTFRDCDFSSERPSIEDNEPCVAGIDEAGRGPVLGPMVYGIVYYPLRVKSAIEKSGFADSKALTEKKREDLFEMMSTGDLANLGWCTRVLSPVTISNSMLRRSKYNLNELSHDTAMTLIKQTVEGGVNVKEVIIDTVGPADKYKAKLTSVFPNMKITVAQKADSLYPVVSAASICAKVVRDRIVSRWQFVEGLESLADEKYGSGYPGDPDTKAFLARSVDKVFGFPTFVRFSWSTASTIMDSTCTECEWESDQEEAASAKNSFSILDFYRPKTMKRKSLDSRFFDERCLKAVVKLA